MDMQFIEFQTSNIRNALKKGRLVEAFEELEKFVAEIGDKELDNQLMVLSARYHANAKAQLQGLKDSIEESNRVIMALTELFSEAKMLALDKVNLRTVAKFEKVSERSQQVLSSLEEVIVLLAESRLLEIEVTKMNFGRAFSYEQNRLMDQHIERFKKLLEDKGQ